MSPGPRKVRNRGGALGFLAARAGRRRRLPDRGHRGHGRHCDKEKETPLPNHWSCPVQACQARVKKNPPIREAFFRRRRPSVYVTHSKTCSTVLGGGAG